MEFTVESVMAQAPDDASAKAAKGLVNPGKWPTLGYDSAAVWGECQGSGSKPYQTQVDLTGLSFKCSCPSRKFPCKHGLALLLLRVQHDNSFKKEEPPPEWVTQWLESRQQRAAKQEQKKEEKQTQAVDPVASAKREAVRYKRMNAGLDELERWLGDHVRHGLAQLPGQAEPWSDMAARMVDAQLPGVAARLRRLEGIVGQGTHWPAQLLGQMGELQLLLQAWRRLEQLSPAEQADVRTAVGLVIDKDEVIRDASGVQNQWLVLGQHHEEEGNLWRRRVWLYGQHNQGVALLLDFSHGGKRFEQAYITGTVLQGTLAFYPSAVPCRAVWVQPPTLTAASNASTASPSAPCSADFLPMDQSLTVLAQSLAHNPWQLTTPLLVNDGVPTMIQNRWYLRTDTGAALPLKINTKDAWQLQAVSGGQALPVMGEWDGEHLQALSAWTSSSMPHRAVALTWTPGTNA